jgi:hypothetical protein
MVGSMGLLAAAGAKATVQGRIGYKSLVGDVYKVIYGQKEPQDNLG